LDIGNWKFPRFAWAASLLKISYASLLKREGHSKKRHQVITTYNHFQWLENMADDVE